jgi:hypothetical protein
VSDPIKFQKIDGIESCYDVLLNGRVAGCVWKATSDRWGARVLGGEKATKLFVSRDLAAIWVERNQPALIGGKRFSARIAARRRALAEAT